MMGWCGNLDGGGEKLTVNSSQLTVSEERGNSRESTKREEKDNAETQRTQREEEERERRRGTITQSLQKREKRRRRPKQTPPLRGPTRHKAARERESEHSARDERFVVRQCVSHDPSAAARKKRGPSVGMTVLR